MGVGVNVPHMCNEVRGQSQVCLSCLRLCLLHCLLHCELPGFISFFPGLLMLCLSLPSHMWSTWMTDSSFMWVLEILTQLLILLWQGLYPLIISSQEKLVLMHDFTSFYSSCGLNAHIVDIAILYGAIHDEKWGISTHNI